MPHEPRHVVTSTPGKVILMGEHAAVYGRPALLAALDLRLEVRIEELPARAASGDAAGGVVHLDLPAVGCRRSLPWKEILRLTDEARQRWESYAANPTAAGFKALRGDSPELLVALALGEAAHSLGRETSDLRLTIDSALPAGCGLGSSAATAVGVIAAYRALRGAPADADLLHRLSLEVERRQHGLPSGVDNAAVIRGGVLWARRTDAGVMELAPVAARAERIERFHVFDTGPRPESTGAVVAAVRERQTRDPQGFEEHLERMAEVTERFRRLLEADGRDRPAADAAEDPIRRAVLEFEDLLEGLGVVPAAVREVVRRVEAAGGAAKICGAGSLEGPGAGSLLVYHPEVRLPPGLDFLSRFPSYSVLLGAPGTRLQDSNHRP